MKLILLILAFVAVVTSFATMPANATTPERMTYGTQFGTQLGTGPPGSTRNWGNSGQVSLQFVSTGEVGTGTGEMGTGTFGSRQ